MRSVGLIWYGTRPQTYCPVELFHPFWFPRDLDVQQGLQHLPMPIHQRNLTAIATFLALLSQQGPVNAFVLAPRQAVAAVAAAAGVGIQPKSNNGNSWGVKSSLASATNAAGEAITSADEAKRNLKEVLEKNSRRTQNKDVRNAIEVRKYVCAFSVQQYVLLVYDRKE